MEKYICKNCGSEWAEPSDKVECHTCVSLFNNSIGEANRDTMAIINVIRRKAVS